MTDGTTELDPLEVEADRIGHLAPDVGALSDEQLQHTVVQLEEEELDERPDA